MNNTLLVDLYELTMAQSYFIYKPTASATFDLFVRTLPPHRAYLIACGLEDVIVYLRNLRFNPGDIRYLKDQKLFSAGFLKYLADFRFRGELWAMPEGTPFFANEPMLRVTAPIIEAQFVESFLLTTIHLQTLIASKAARVVQAAGDKRVFDFSLRRTHGGEAGLKAARASYIAGASGTSNCLAGKLYDIPLSGTMAHSFVMSFREEIDSFLAYSATFPGRAILLVDTYDTRRGIANAITVGLYLREKGHRLYGIRLDSGDILSLSRLARRMLDKAGLSFVKIFASGNLDEFKISALSMKGAPVDSFGVGTHMGTSSDQPSLDLIYKISEVTDETGNFLPTMKLSADKVTYPGRKQVFRISDSSGIYRKDILGLQGEKNKGSPLLRKMMSKGRLVCRLPRLDEIRSYAQKSIACLPAQLKDVHSSASYSAQVSPQLAQLRRRLSRQLVRLCE